MSIVSPLDNAYTSRMAGWTDITRAQPTDANRLLVYLGLGSNLGDRLGMLQQAIDAMHALPLTEVQRCSGVYETEPWGFTEQGRFLNCAVELRCGLGPHRLLEALLGIERALGRERTLRYGPRSIDIDILLYGAEVIDTEGLTIPHPHIAERNFVLQPLREIASDVRHPVENCTIEELAARNADAGDAVKTDLRLEASARRE
jgi:2-amino-4-hydroxy-6-hydroxymethyldihydropteridine diphosphokinase